MTDTAPAAPDAPTADRSAAVPPQPARPRALSLRQNFSWTFAGNVVNAASQLGLISLMAKLGDAAMVGTYSWALAIVMPIMTLAMLQLRVVFITDVAGRHTFGEYLSVRLIAMALGVTAIALYGMLTGAALLPLLTLILVGVSRAIDGLNDLYRAYFQKAELMHLSGISMGTRGIAALLAVGVGLWLTQDLLISLASLCIIWTLMVIFSDLPRSRKLAAEQDELSGLKLHLSWPIARELIVTAAPMGLVMALGTLQTSIPRLYLDSWHGSDAVGYFSAILYPISAGMIVVAALGHSALPRLSNLYSHDRRAFGRLLWRLLGIAVALGLLVFITALLAGRPLLHIAYTAEFARYYWEFVIVSASTVFLFLSTFLGYAMSAARQFRIQPMVALTYCIVALIACAVLVPRQGVMGAAMAYAVSVTGGFVTSVICVLWLLRHPRTLAPADTDPNAASADNQS